MIKKQKEKQTTLQRNPYMFYVTNWGFVEPTKPETKQNQKR